MNDMAKGNYYTLKEVSKLLRVSERTMYRYIKSGKLKAIKIGYWRIDKQSLDAFIKRSSNQ